MTQVNTIQGPKAEFIHANQQQKQIKVGQWTFEFRKDEIVIRDTHTGEVFRSWGDPHVSTGDGDKGQFHEKNLTLDLPDGTKVTIVPTEKGANGKAWIQEVNVMSGDEGMVVTGIHSGDIRFGDLDSAANVDARHVDGNVMYSTGSIEKWHFAANGKEWTGTSEGGGEHNLDDIGGYSSISFENDGFSGDTYSRLFEVLTKIENRVKDRVDELEDLSRLQELSRLKDKENPDAKDNAQIRKLENWAKGKGFDTEDLSWVNGAVQKAQYEVQMLVQEKSQIAQMATSLSKADHDAKRAVISNWAAR